MTPRNSPRRIKVTLAKTRVWHSLRNNYFPLYFPEIDRFIRSDHTECLIHLLLRFSTPASITAFTETEFPAEAWNLVGRTRLRCSARSTPSPDVQWEYPCRSTLRPSPCFG